MGLQLRPIVMKQYNLLDQVFCLSVWLQLFPQPVTFWILCHLPLLYQVAPFPSCNPTVAIASTPNPIVANPMTSVASPISASMSPFSPTFIEDTGPSLDSTLELSFDPSYEADMDQSIATTPNNNSETNATQSVATTEEVRTSETENEGILNSC